MIVDEIKLYEMLKAKLGVQEAETFMEFWENVWDKRFGEKKTELATKMDLHVMEVKLSRRIYYSATGQFLALAGTLVAIWLMKN